MLSPELTGKKIKLVIKGTKVPPLFRKGQYENCVVSLISIEDQDTAKVHFLPKCTTRLIPWKYLEPFEPSAIGENVVIICGEKVGSEYVFCKISEDEFSLAFPFAPKFEIITQPKHYLGILSRV